MRALAPIGLFALATGYVLAHFTVLFFNQWYFAGFFWVKVACLTPVTAALFFSAWLGVWRRLWTGLGIYWICIHILAVLNAWGWSLTGLTFTEVLDHEAAMVWVPVIAITVYAIVALRAREFIAGRQQRQESAELNLRARLRRRRNAGVRREADNMQINTLILVAGLACAMNMGQSAAAEEQNGTLNPAGDRHSELTLADLSSEPAWPDQYESPLHLRERETFWIVIENWRDGRIYVREQLETGLGMPWVAGTRTEHDLGSVLAPVANINKQGFTASGWAEPGAVCASAVNAIHIKTDHKPETGRAVLFTLQPLEFADFDPADYLSYFNKSSSLFTDIPGGTGIFGGGWAPLAGSAVMYRRGEMTAAELVGPGWVPADGDQFEIRVERRKYNPEYIEFENRYGGLIWIREIGMEPYPVGQVLKPVGGTGRFGGTLYADTGRIRAAHPGVIDIATSPVGEIGGFQIIPRDHSMSPEMSYARLKTQWMVVGPLWALDPSWEGIPPLFSDYLYPAFNPALNDDGTVNEVVSGAGAFLDRFTVRARYRDADDPEAWELLHEEPKLDNYSLKDLSHLRIYFPRGH